MSPRELSHALHLYTLQNGSPVLPTNGNQFQVVPGIVQAFLCDASAEIGAGMTLRDVDGVEWLIVHSASVYYSILALVVRLPEGYQPDTETAA